MARLRTTVTSIFTISPGYWAFWPREDGVKEDPFTPAELSWMLAVGLQTWDCVCRPLNLFFCIRRKLYIVKLHQHLALCNPLLPFVAAALMISPGMLRQFPRHQTPTHLLHVWQTSYK